MSTRLETDARELEAPLPEPVSRFFATALPAGRPIVAGARVKQEGTFRMGESASSWRPFEATQTFGAYPPRFEWDARIRVFPGVRVRVRDSYRDGVGSMRGTVAGLFTVVNAGETPELASGALQRYLAEAMWFPTRLLPCRGVRWEPIDAESARVTLVDSPVVVSLDVRFNADGSIASVTTPARFREQKGQYVKTPWEAICIAHEKRAGMVIPIEVEVAWYLPTGRLPYWRGRITEAAYEFAA